MLHPGVIRRSVAPTRRPQNAPAGLTMGSRYLNDPREFTTRPSWQRPAPLAGGELREHYRRDSAYLQSPKDLRSYGMGSSSEPGENRSAALERKNMAENKLAQKQTGLVAVTEEGLCTRPVERPAITEHEVEQLQRANASNLQPIVFVHGLWLLPSSWDRWATLFEEAGYTALSPGWPDDPETVEEANANPEILAHKTIGQLADHCEQTISRLNRQRAIIGHSFGR